MARKAKSTTSASASERNAQLTRLLRVLRDLDRLGGMDLYELAERHGASVRTIRRDLEALQAAGLPLVEEPAGRRKRWRVQYSDKLQRLSELVDASHYLALKVAMGQAGPARSSSTLYAMLEDLSDKLEEALGSNERKLLSTIDQCFYSYEKFGYLDSAPDVFWPLVTAISDERLCRVVYRSPRADGKESRFRILPLRLFTHEQAVYLHAHVPRYDDIITMNLQRLVKLEVLKDKGKVPKRYDPQKWEGATFGIFSSGKPVEYRMRFAEDVAPYIRERNWHPSQKLRKLRDGRLELRFSCAQSPEVTSWVASWRDKVEVLEPGSLREHLAEVGRWLTQTYGA
jgi:proteasome accessory factor B